MSAIDYDLKKIRGIAFDVDGVLSAATIPLAPDGEPLRLVNTKDGYAIQLAIKRGLRLAIITGGTTHGVQKRFENLGIENVFMRSSHKLPVLQRWMEAEGFTPEQVAFAGDDIPDIPAMEYAGLACCPSDAAPEVKRICRYISHREGGYGVGRDIIEQVLKAQDKWMSDDVAFGW